MRSLLLGAALVGLGCAPAWAEPYRPDYSTHPNCMVMGEKTDGSPVLRPCQPEPGSREHALRESAKNLPPGQRAYIMRLTREREAEDLKRRLHEENVERWSPPVPKRERGI